MLHWLKVEALEPRKPGFESCLCDHGLTSYWPSTSVLHLQNGPSGTYRRGFSEEVNKIMLNTMHGKGQVANTQ